MNIWRFIGRRQEDDSLRRHVTHELGDRRGWLVGVVAVLGFLLASRSRFLRRGARMAWQIGRPYLMARLWAGVMQWLRHRR